MKRFYTLISYVFFPGTMAMGGFALLEYVEPSARLPWHFWPLLIFCFAAFPVLAIFLFIRLGILEDIHVAKRKARNISYPLAIGGALLGLLYLSWVIHRWETPAGQAFGWGLAINASLLFLWIINAVGLKVSAHATGTSGFLALTLVMHPPFSWGLTTTAVLIFALVYLARRGLSAHSHIELIAGFCLGFITTFAVFSL